jgi:hypothetical protein
MSRQVVAGATGRVGAIALGDLLARGKQVTVVLRDRARSAPWSDRGAGIRVAHGRGLPSTTPSGSSRSSRGIRQYPIAPARTS